MNDSLRFLLVEDAPEDLDLSLSSLADYCLADEVAAARELVAELRWLWEAAGLGDALSKRGVHRSDVHELAEFALRDHGFATNPRRPSQRDPEVIYEESL